MDITTVLVIVLAALLVAVVAHKALIDRYSDPLEVEMERIERARARDKRSEPKRGAAFSAAEKIGRALPLTKAASDETAAALALAGMRLDPATWHGVQLLALAACALCGLVLGTIAGGAFAMAVLIACGCACGILAPRLFLMLRTDERRDKIEADLPDTLDLLGITVRAGSSVDRAFKLVASKTDGPLSEELSQVDRDINMFNFRNVEALEHMSRRCSSRQVGEFCSAMIQSINQGSSISRVLAGQAKIARAVQYDKIEEKTNTIPTKVIIPMALSFVPATLLMGVAPQVASLMSFLGQISM